ncbi:MAG: prephenate dehydrogenase, partial [Anaerolineales bacterium]
LVLATPVRTILAQLAQLSYSNSPLVLLDLGSTKREICAAMDALPDSFDPLGGHPMCGKETAGIESAAANLFANAAFVLAPLARTSPKALALAEELVAAVGARPLLLDPARHDNLVAVTSHLPYLLACSLMTAAATDAADDEQLWSVAASGFRDTTRLSASDVRVMADIIATNRDPILAALSRQRAELERLQAILAAGDDSILFEYLSHARGARTAQQ